MAAKSLLADISSSSANDFLQSVRYWTSPPGNSFFAPFDTILESYDHARIGTSSTLMRGDVIEVQGPAASGKTQMLQFFAMTTCLPRTWEVALSVRGSSRPPRKETIAIGGRDSCVAILDCDGRFSIERTYHLVRSHLARRVQEHAATIPALYSAEAEVGDLHEATLVALSKVHIFKPSSLASLAGTLHNLPTYMEKSSTGELTFVLIDGISSFYWQDRYYLEKGQTLPQNGKVVRPTPPMRYVVEAVNALKAQLGVVTVIANMAFPNSGDRQPSLQSPFFRQHLARPYPSPFAKGAAPVEQAAAGGMDPLRSQPGNQGSLVITHHLTLHAAPVKQVSRDTTLDNTVKEEPFRSMDQQELGSTVFVRMPGIEQGDEIGRWELVIRDAVIDGL